jgi:hypothetical protein
VEATGGSHSPQAQSHSTESLAPVISGQNAFGSGTQTAGSLQGTVYFIPADSRKFPDVSQIKPTATLFTEQLNIPARSFSDGFPGIDNRFEWFAVRYEGFVEVSRTADYTFRLLSDDGALLYIDGALVVDDDGVHAVSSKSGSVKLTSGRHTIRVDYFQGPRFQIALQLFANRAGEPERLWSSLL